MNSQEPKLSVCLITYKHELYIEQAIESILMQKVNFAWEIIIADDCSPDETRKIIRKYQQLYPNRIRTIFQQKNVGAGKNFVDLINAARGKYVAYIEGDDYWTDEYKLQKQFDFMHERPDFSLCYHKIKWVYTYECPHDPDAESNVDDPPESTIYDILRKGWFIRSCSMFYINFKLPVGFENLMIGDYPLHILLASMGRIGFLNEQMGVYRINNNGASETTFITTNTAKIKQNIKNQINMLKYLNRETAFRYKSEINSKVIGEIHQLLSVSLKENKKKFLAELKNIIAVEGLRFIIVGFTQKLFRAKYLKR